MNGGKNPKNLTLVRIVCGTLAVAALAGVYAASRPEPEAPGAARATVTCDGIVGDAVSIIAFIDVYVDGILVDSLPRPAEGGAWIFSKAYDWTGTHHVVVFDRTDGDVYHQATGNPIEDANVNLVCAEGTTSTEPVATIEPTSTTGQPTPTPVLEPTTAPEPATTPTAAATTVSLPPAPVPSSSTTPTTDVPPSDRPSVPSTLPETL